MATKKPTRAAKPKKPIAKKPAAKAKTPAAKTAAAKNPASRKKAADPVVLTPPAQKTPASKSAPADIIDAEVVVTSAAKPKETPKPSGKKPTPPAGEMPKPATPQSGPATNKGNGSLIRVAVLVGVGVIAIAIIVSVVGKMTSGNDVPVASADSLTQLQESVEARLGKLEASVGKLSDNDGGGEVADLAVAVKNLGAAINMSEAKTKSKLKKPAEAVAQLETRLALTEEKLTALENAPVAAGAVSPEAPVEIAQNGEEIAKLKEMLAAQTKANADLAAQVAVLMSGQSKLQIAKAEVVELTETVQENTDEADLALALTSLSAALESGVAYGNLVQQIETLSGSALPKSLTDAAPTGVKPLYVLQQEFPDAARIALKASLLAESGDGVASKFSAFVKSQISARSLEERDGEDPDAILSRAEGALSRGRLKSAVSLVKQLPEAGLAAMESWLDDAQTRVRAEVALKRLAQSLAPDN